MRKIVTETAKPVGLLNSESHRFIIFLIKITIKKEIPSIYEDEEKYVLSCFQWTKEFGIHINSFKVITPQHLIKPDNYISEDYKKVADMLGLDEKKIYNTRNNFMFDCNYAKWNGIFMSIHNAGERMKKKEDENYDKKAYIDMEYDIFLKNHLSPIESKLLRDELVEQSGSVTTFKNIYDNLLASYNESQLNGFFISLNGDEKKI